MTIEKIQIKKENIGIENTPSSKISEKKRRLLQILLFYILIIGLVGGLYYYAQKQHKESQALKEELIKLQKNQKKDLQLYLKQQNETLKRLDVQKRQWTDQFSELEKKVASLCRQSHQTWRLSEANFWIKMAERKLRRDQDIKSAILLLKSADENLAKINDPGLIEVRQALISDITTLSALHQVDFDGIILKLNEMSDQVDDLPLSPVAEEDQPMEEQAPSVSDSLSEWRQNIKKNWARFFSSWITVRHRDSKAEPLLSPDQSIYLRENIRSHLLIAAQAVARRQNRIYHQSLEMLPTWINTYFDTQDIHNKLFLENLKELQQQNVSIKMPEHLKTPFLMKKWLQSLMHRSFSC